MRRVDVVIEKLGDYSKMMAEDDSRQHLVNMSNTWGDIRQQIGGVLDYNFGPWLAKLDEAFLRDKDQSCEHHQLCGCCGEKLS